MSDNNIGFISDKAIVDTDKIGNNTRIWGGVHILNGAKIGNNCNICEGCFIESKVTIGNNVTIKNGISIWDLVTIEDDVFLGPHMVFTNDPIPRSGYRRDIKYRVPTVIKKGATIGANATILCGIEIGEYATIGAGSVVTKTVSPHHLVFGNPARHKGYVCFCGYKINFIENQAECTECGKRFSKSNNIIEL